MAFHERYHGHDGVWRPGALHRDWRILLPRSLLGVGAFINKYIAPLPGIRRLCLRNYVVARPAPPQSQPVAPPLVQRSRAVPQ